MKKKLTAITLATAMVIGSPLLSNYSYAETTQELDEIQNQRETINKDLSQAEGEVADVLSEIEDINKEIDRVNQELIEEQALIDRTEQDINYTVDEMKVLQDEIKELEKSIEKRHEILKSRAASYQKTGGSVDYLEVVFGSSSFSDFISRVTTVNKIVESDATLMEQLEKDIEKVEENQKLVLDKLDELNKMKSAQEETVAFINEQKLQNEKNREVLENKQQELSALVGDLKDKDSNLASLESEVKQSIAATAQKASQTERENNTKENQEEKTPEKKKVKAEPDTNLEHKSKVEEKPEKKKETKKEKEDDKVLTMTATAYTISSAGGTGVTATGINLKKNPNTKVIAVDPNVIPLGTLVRVEGYGYAVAGDIGSAIKGNKIDVFVPNQKAAKNWGVRTVKVTIQ